MRAFDDDVSYTRIIDPAPPTDELALPAPGDQPQLVWRPRLGDQQAYPLAGRITRWAGTRATTSCWPAQPSPRATRRCASKPSASCWRIRAA